MAKVPNILARALRGPTAAAALTVPFVQFKQLVTPHAHRNGDHVFAGRCGPDFIIAADVGSPRLGCFKAPKRRQRTVTFMTRPGAVAPGLVIAFVDVVWPERLSGPAAIDASI